MWFTIAPRLAAIGVTVLASLVAPSTLRAQDPDSLQRRADSLRADSLAQDSLPQPLDTAVAARLGLPTSPSRSFPQADSVLERLLGLEGFRTTRYAGDSVTFLADIREIRLNGAAMVQAQGMTLEADSVAFQQETCVMRAAGDPKLFEGSTVLVGDTMMYNTCENRGVVREALTSFNQSGVDWYLNGGLGIDSAAVRIYTGRGEITSCDETEPHYHFAAGRMKWVKNHILVASPATLYVRDVPIAWFPFIFQDMRTGRRTGMLTPRFGFNDLVRPNQGYRRHVTNVGYYFVLNNYMDLQASLDWLSGTSVSVNGDLAYRWLDRFINGGIAVSRIFESGIDGGPGRRSLRLVWNHQQNFSQRTSLRANVDFASSSSVIQQNTVDPMLQTAQLTSSVNFQKQLDWGTLSVGGTRRQDLTNDEVSQTLPSISLTPSPIALGADISWNPSFTFTAARTRNQRSGLIDVPPVDGLPQGQDTLFYGTRNTTLNVSTPLRIGQWNWQNRFSVIDEFSGRREVLSLTDPGDSTSSITRVYGESFQTGIDWSTGINLPSLFSSTFKLQPSINIQNATSGPFLIRNRFTDGRFVQQGKRFALGASMSPTLFGFFPGAGPVERIRHAVSLQVGWSYALPASVNQEYLDAVDPRGTRLDRPDRPLHTIRLGLSQTFEGKYRQEGADSAAVQPQNAQKLKILQWQTSGLEYDIEQAKEPGMNGWRTPSLTNSFTSDLLRGFRLSVTHDLWDGPVGFDTTAFDPFLRSVSASFSVGGRSIRRLFESLFGGAPLSAPTAEDARADSVLFEDPSRFRNEAGPRTAFRSVETLSAGPRGGGGFKASITYSDQRQRQDDEQPVIPGATSGNLRTVGLDIAFSPTSNWNVRWNTQYNMTTNEFGQHMVRLDRDLHRWRATFGYTQTPTGTFAFTFFVSLLDQPEIKFNYDQQTVER
jgi:hypothetical protein